ncbi:MAG TPA: FKBP-type peptidyl-prolyl cis-trans isomerase [Gemmatales bacterium]|nr:FKBP-type peptidyl-prolyl cis-trans isomerase [Gemmatales bacterium]HMP61043.1 FKBP-type peptidyl-prolyl cis-trans isomerase [Gemmatales bacterium]
MHLRANWMRSLMVATGLALGVGPLLADDPASKPTEPPMQEKKIDVDGVQFTLRYQDLKVGDGEEVRPGDTVTVHYTGWLTVNGTKFDSSHDSGRPFKTRIGVRQVIRGWDEGLPGMRVGGKRKLLIPSPLAYGAQGRGRAIPPNSDLTFEIELLRRN